MRVTVKGHPFGYEIENVTRLFFRDVTIDGAEDEKGEEILTEIENGSGSILLKVSVLLGGNETVREKELPLGSEPKEQERELAALLFHELCARTGKRPAWGIVTGIRPAKYANILLAQGYTRAEAEARFVEKNLVTPEKAELALEVSEHSRAAEALCRNDSYSLYVSIPFCPTRCSYCSFVSKTVGRDKKMLGEYLEKLIEELHDVKRHADGLGLNLETVYIGGGTPTTLSAEQLERLTGTLNDVFGACYTREFSVEAGRPDTITEEKLRVLKDAGVTRLSINPQTGNDEVLKAVGRTHTAADIEACFRMAREIGFDNINADLIAGLPGDTPESFRKTLDWIGAIDPENVTIHALTLKRASRMRDEGELGGSGVSEMVEDGYRFLKDRGYLPYYMYKQKGTLEGLENTGYAKSGFDCLYNIFIMEEMHTIIACGAGAVSKMVNRSNGLIERIFNYKYPAEYISGFDVIRRRKDALEDFYGRWRERD